MSVKDHAELESFGDPVFTHRGRPASGWYLAPALLFGGLIVFFLVVLRPKSGGDSDGRLGEAMEGAFQVLVVGACVLGLLVVLIAWLVASKTLRIYQTGFTIDGRKSSVLYRDLKAVSREGMYLKLEFLDGRRDVVNLSRFRLWEERLQRMVDDAQRVTTLSAERRSQVQEPSVGVLVGKARAVGSLWIVLVSLAFIAGAFYVNEFGAGAVALALIVGLVGLTFEEMALYSDRLYLRRRWTPVIVRFAEVTAIERDGLRATFALTRGRRARIDARSFRRRPALFHQAVERAGAAAKARAADGGAGPVTAP